MLDDDRFIAPRWNYPGADHHMRSSGNLTYLGFIRLVEQIWTNSHPKIPFVATGGKQHPQYPCIVYKLQLRKTMPFEPKKRPRDQIYEEDGSLTMIDGQRFQNLVIFTAVTEQNPRLAEELIEDFEDFMHEIIPALKKCGLSEIVFARRLPDDEEVREAEEVCKRSVAYLVTTEKIYRSNAKALQEITIYVRKLIESNFNFATPSTPNL